ncbi:MAG: hypothetical protein LQ348_003766 [Seirophora lacunosa]|nr:MAG: hypothetical protein LQ348_003766 [Seirophora lacunosa]
MPRTDTSFKDMCHHRKLVVNAQSALLLKAMPPLMELSVNRPGKKQQASLDGAKTSSGKRQLPSLALDGNASSLPSTSAIQSMLKNTTELGDIGDFAAKPTGIPRHASTKPAHPRAYQHQYVRRPYDHYAAGHQGSKIRQNRSHPNQRDPSLHHSRSLRTNEGHSIISDSQDQRSNSVTQSSINSRRGSVHPSLLNIRPYGRPGPRPRSPYAYPTRLKRPGHRSYYPAYTEITLSDSAIHTGVHRAYSNRTASPLSNSSMQKLPRPWIHGFGLSDPLLHQHPAALLSRRHDGNRSPPFLRRAALPRSPLASRGSSFTGKSSQMKASDSGSSGRRVPSPMPLFYDYSEAFEQESFNHTAQRSSLFEARFIPQSDGSSEGYQADVTTTSTTDTKCSTSSTESKVVASQGLKQQPLEHKETGLEKCSASSSSEILTSLSDATPVAKILFWNDAMDKGVQRPPSIYDPTPKVIKATTAAMRLSSSSSGSQYSSSAHSLPGRTADLPSIKAPEMIHERQPKALSVSFNHGNEFQQRSASLDDHVSPESSKRFPIPRVAYHGTMEDQMPAEETPADIGPRPDQIFAPVPERSMSSRNSRDRFSRILSIGEGDMLMNAFPNNKATMTIQQYLRDRKAPTHRPTNSITKRLPPLPDDPPLMPMPMPSKGKEKEVDVPPKDQFGLRPKQRLEKYGDAYSIIEPEHATAFNGLGLPGIPQRYSSISNNPLSDVPESSRSVRTSILSQRPVSGEQLRRFALTPRNSSLFQTMKDLPPLPKEAVVAVPPPQTSGPPPELPCLFTPLLQDERLDTAVASIKDSPGLVDPDVGVSSSGAEVEWHTPPQSFMAGQATKPASTASHASARPWNLDASYPWAGTPPKLEVSIPQPAKAVAPVEKRPRFKLNVRRASAMGGSGKLLKVRPPHSKVIPSPAARKDVVSRSPRLTENSQSGPRNITALVPPSPGLQVEAQSFFSDDSSQRERKNSIRRRLSQIRGAMRVASSDEIRAQANPSSGLSRSSKSSSKRSSTAAEVNISRKTIKWKMLDKIKSWLHRTDEKFRKWRRKLSPRHHHTRPLGTHLQVGE